MQKKHHKPDTRKAMDMLIQQVRSLFPFNTDQTRLCQDYCRGCPKKLLEYIDHELEDWEHRLNAGETPNFGQLHRLGHSCNKIRAVLRFNGLL